MAASFITNPQHARMHIVTVYLCMCVLVFLHWCICVMTAYLRLKMHCRLAIIFCFCLYIYSLEIYGDIYLHESLHTRCRHLFAQSCISIRSCLLHLPLFYVSAILFALFIDNELLYSMHIGVSVCIIFLCTFILSQFMCTLYFMHSLTIFVL